MTQPLSSIAAGTWRGVARSCVLIAGLFCVLVATRLGVLWIQQKMHHPLLAGTSGQIAALRDQLQTRPSDAGLKNQLRQADADLRQAYWTRHTQMMRGALLLLAGAVVLVGGLKAMQAMDRRLPRREQILAADQSDREMAWAQWTIAAVGAIMTILLLCGARWSLDHPVIAVEPSLAVAAEAPVTIDQLLEQWPAFHGFGGAAAHVPDPAVRSWNASSGQNILWHTPVSLPGNSSPVIWNNTIVLTGATAAVRKVMAFDLTTGKSIWQTAVGGSGPAPAISEDTSFAAPTPVSDGHRAYAIFPTGDIAAVDLITGRKIWEKNLGQPVSAYGYAASLAIFTDSAGTKIIVQWDMAAAEDHKSSLIALDGRTGKLLWQTRRPVGASWASPLVTNVPGDPNPWQIITAANPLVIGYDASTGTQLWSADVLGGDVAPSPCAAVIRNAATIQTPILRYSEEPDPAPNNPSPGRTSQPASAMQTSVFAAEEGAARVALPITNIRGDATPAWKLDDEGLPDIVSPVSDGRYVWTIVGSGDLFCFDAATGQAVWDHDFSTRFQATPVVIGTGPNRELWITEATTGLTHRLAIAAEFKELSSNPLGEAVAASPAFSDTGGQKRIVIRGKNNLYSIGAPAAVSRVGTPRENHLSNSPSPGTPGEGRGEGDFESPTALLLTQNHPHPNPLPEYQERGPDRAKPNDFALRGTPSSPASDLSIAEAFRASSFGFRHSFGDSDFVIASSFGIRHSFPGAETNCETRMPKQFRNPNSHLCESVCICGSNLSSCLALATGVR